MLCLRLLGSAALVGLLAAAPAIAWAAPGDLHNVTAEGTNLRTKPSEEATVARQLTRGEELLELRHEGDWYGVRIMGTGEEGWISSKLTQRVARSALGEPSQPAAATPGGDKASAGEDGQVVFREEGQASVYGDEFQGKKTASGKRFDQNKSVAAHPELPLGSDATVVNPDTGKKVEVEIVDRGPHAKGRDIDLSKAAAKELGITKEVSKEGDAAVRIEATEGQVEEAIDSPKDVKKVEEQLKEARREAAQDGTPQPKGTPDLEAPQEEAGRR